MRARILGPLLLVAVSIVGTLLALELGLRFLADDVPLPPAPTDLPEAERDLPVLRSFVDLARPNQRGLFKDVPYRTNSAGFRGPETPRAKPPGTWRIVIVGDSVTMGSGVREEDTYASQLASMLDAPPGRRYEVLNLGLAGLAAQHAMDRLERIGLRFDPDLLVYGFTLNDLEGPAYVYRRKHLEAKGAEESILEVPRADGGSKLLTLLRDRFASARELLGMAPDSYAAELQANYFENPKAWAQFLAQLDRLRAAAERQGVCAVVFIHADLHHLGRLHPFTPIYELVAYAADARGLHAVGSLPALLGHETSSLWVNALDTPTPRGIA